MPVKGLMTFTVCYQRRSETDLRELADLTILAYSQSPKASLRYQAHCCRNDIYCYFQHHPYAIVYD